MFPVLDALFDFQLLEMYSICAHLQHSESEQFDPVKCVYQPASPSMDLIKLSTKSD